MFRQLTWFGSTVSPETAWCRRRFLFVATLLAILTTGMCALGQEEGDDEPQVVGQVLNMQFEIPKNQFDRFVFQQLQTAQAARSQLEKRLALRTDDVNLACKLSDAQVPREED